MPVPSSVVTKSPARIGEPPGVASPARRSGPRRSRPDELRAPQAPDDLGALAEHALDERLGDDQRLAAERTRA